MGSGNWIVDNVNSGLNTWNAKLAEIWQLISQSPETFKGGAIWNVVRDIFGALQAVGYGLLVLFFVIGVIKTAGSFTEVKRPEHAFKLFLRFILAKATITYGLELLKALFEIAQGVITTAISASGLGANSEVVIPGEVVEAINNLGFFDSIPVWAVSLIGSLVITVLSFVMIMSVYGRFFRLYIFAAIAPVPLAAFAGEPSASIGKSFLKSYASICLEGAVIVIACIIYTVFMGSPPAVDPSASATTIVWSYLGELIFNLLVLTGAVKMADRLVKEMFGM